MSSKRPPIVILLSGNGSNFQAILDAQLPIDIQAVISDKATAFGLQRAQQAGIPTEVVDRNRFGTRAEFDQALQTCIASYQPELIVLAGFMRILNADLVAQYPNRIINIHPSLLPKYPGLDTHQRVLDAQDIAHGVSIHYVTAELDAGPLIAQACFKVPQTADVALLTERAHHLEHQMYPQVIQWLAQGLEFR